MKLHECLKNEEEKEGRQYIIQYIIKIYIKKILS